jgi:uncharacterized ferredoxin-like protein
MAASSGKSLQWPVLPLPVMPTQTPWVVRCIVQQRLVEELAARQVERLAEIKDPQFLKIHANLLRYRVSSASAIRMIAPIL